MKLKLPILSFASSKAAKRSTHSQPGQVWQSLCSFHSSRGLTILELLVASLLALLVTGLVLSSTVANRYVLARDIVRTRLNQNLRGALDIIGLDIRIAGQSLGTNFPAIEIAQPTGLPAVLTLRRAVIDEILPLCQSLTTGQSAPRIYFAKSGTTAGCALSGQTHNFESWRDYRVSQGGTVEIFIYDYSAKRGQFLSYTGETQAGSTDYYLSTSGTLTYNYPTSSTAIYILEEWVFKVENQMLQLVQNRNSGNPQNVSFGISDFQAEVEMSDGTLQNTFTSSDVWTQMAGITISITGSDHFAGLPVTRTLSGRFYPRNILSN